MSKLQQIYQKAQQTGKPLKQLAESHFTFDLLLGNYVGVEGNAEYDTEYQRLVGEEALRCAACW